MRCCPICLLAPLLLLAPTASPAKAASPDDPQAAVPAERYLGVLKGTRSYRPVEPLPWGDVNRRVDPQAGRRKPAARRHGEAPVGAPPRKP
jgi:hypothetical protein